APPKGFDLKVVVRQGGYAVPGASVGVKKGNFLVGKGTSDAAGTDTFKARPAGAYPVGVGKNSVNTAHKPPSDTRHGRGVVDLTAKKPDAPRAFDLKVVVQNKSGAQPLQGAYVEVKRGRPWSGRARAMQRARSRSRDCRQAITTSSWTRRGSRKKPGR